MSYFVVNACTNKACQSWRIGDKCVKDQLNIEWATKRFANIHDSTSCQIRKQIDEYRLTKMLET
jgi:hypothetical protein